MPNSSQRPDNPRQDPLHQLQELVQRVVPDDAGAQSVAKSVRDLLGPDGPHRQGYRAGSRQNIWSIVAAVWAALDKLALTFAPEQHARATASSDHTSQLDMPAPDHTPRLPSAIVSQRVATRPEISLLLASILESLGLHPILIYCADTLLAGCWLTSNTLAGSSLQDPVYLRQLLRADEIIVLDPAAIYGLQQTDLSSSVARAHGRVAAQHDPLFVGMVDIVRTRAVAQSLAARARRVASPPAMATIDLGSTGLSRDGSTARTGSTMVTPALAPFDPPVEDAAALNSLAVALNMPRAQVDEALLHQAGRIALPAAARQKREMHYVLPADGDQRLAVKAITGQESFVVIAPAGTGAQQTIANVISEALFQGQQILYIADGCAHREAVHRHLTRAGLAHLCDVRTAQFSSQYRQKNQSQSGLTDTAAGRTSDGQGEPSANVRQALARVQQRRLAYFETLHARDADGWSLHQALGICIDYPPALREAIAWRKLDSENLPSPQTLERIRQQDDEHDVGIPAQARLALAAVGQTTWSAQWEESLINACDLLISESTQLESQAENFARALAPNCQPSTQGHYLALHAIASQLLTCTRRALELAGCGRIAKIRDEVAHALRLVEDHDQISRAMSCTYRPDSELSLPIEHLVQLHDQLMQSRWPMSAMITRRMRAILKPEVIQDSGKPDPRTDVAPLQRRHAIREELHELAYLHNHFGPAWQEINSNFLAIFEQIDAAEQLHQALSALLSNGSPDAQSDQDASIRLDAISSEASDNGSLAALQALCRAYLAAHKTHDAALAAFVGAAVLSERVSGGEGETWPGFLRGLASSILRHRWDLKDWCEWRSDNRLADDSNLDTVIRQLFNAPVDFAEVADALRYACARSWLHGTLAGDSTDETDESAAQSRLADSSLQSDFLASHRRSSDEFRHQIALQVSNAASARDGTDPGPERLLPLVIASPEQFMARFDYDRDKFDLLILGDASHLCVQETTPLLAHANRVVFVTDINLPPAPARQALYEGLHRPVSACGIGRYALALGLQAVALKFDYSGRDPALVELANWARGDLPIGAIAVPPTPYRALQLTLAPDAIFGANEQRTNPSEAQMVVKQALLLLRDWVHLPIEQYPGLSIITVTHAQAELIRTNLHQACQAEPILHRFVAGPATNALSVRTLAAASERSDDMVIFSTTMAATPSSLGRAVLDPFRAPDSDRLLYGVVSAARRKLHIITSLSEQMILADSDSEQLSGLQFLTRLLRAGARASFAAAVDPLDRPDRSSANHTDHLNRRRSDSFSDAVRKALTLMGWQFLDADQGIGVDLVVENPDEPGNALAGLVTDSSYGAARRLDVVRRDDCQERAVLAIGWKLIQVWPLSWWQQPDQALKQVHGSLQNLLNQEQARTALTRPVPRHALKPYRRVQRDDVPYCDPDALLDDHYTPELARLINTVVAQEGPIRSDVLVTRIAQLHSLVEVDAALRARIAACTVGFQTSRDGSFVFVWPTHMSPATLRFRPAASAQDKRSFAEIAPQELAAAARDFGITAQTPDAPRQLARAIGVAYPDSLAIRQRLEAAVANSKTR